MRPSSLLVLAVLVLLGALAVHAAVVGAPYKGQEANKGHGLVKGQGPFEGQHPTKGKVPIKTQGPKVGTKAGTCPRVLIRCAMMNPPNACLRDSECQGLKKCCEGSCGRKCMTPH